MIYGNLEYNFYFISISIYYRFSRSIQRFPQIYENSSNNFRSYRSTDFVNKDFAVSNSKPVQQTIKRDIPITINRSRSCSEGRNRGLSPPVLIRKGSLYSK